MVVNPVIGGTRLLPNQASWLVESSCEDEVLRLWTTSSGLVPERLRLVGRGLDCWFRRLRCSRKVSTAALKRRLESLAALSPTDDVLGEIIETKLALNYEYDKAELYWEQRARANWLRHGDRNTSFFHRFASQRKRNNTISYIHNDQGTRVEAVSDILGVATDYFSDIFTSQGFATFDHILEGRLFGMEWEHSGLYSVRSGYRLLMGSILVPPDDKKLFRTLWTIDCPPKFKIQVWKFIWNYAPTKSTLFTKRLTSDSLCPLCISAMEDITHALIDCPLASSIWSYLGYNWPIAVHHGAFKEWLSWLFTTTPITKYVEILVTLYAIWYARNKFVHEGSRQTREEILSFIKSMTTDLQNISARLQGPSSHSLIAWSAPSPPFVKANFDAKFCSVSHSSWSGVIIRDNQGHVLGACRCKALRIPSPFAAEAMSLIHAISLASDLGFHSVIFEGDSLALIKKMNFDALDFSKISALVWEAKGLARTLHVCRFLFVPRGGNQAAHALAGESSLDSTDRYWVEEVPPKVLLLVEADRRYAPPS
ncbi:hypothetical protein GQ457_04G002610 [Hibiscus cannabinus]